MRMGKSWCNKYIPLLQTHRDLCYLLFIYHQSSYIAGALSQKNKENKKSEKETLLDALDSFKPFILCIACSL